MASGCKYPGWVSLDAEGTRRLERLEENLGAADVTLNAVVRPKAAARGFHWP